MKKRALSLKHVLAAMLFLGGFAAVFYPLIATYSYECTQSSVVEQFVADADEQEETLLIRTLHEAQEYNRSLVSSQSNIADPFEGNSGDEKAADDEPVVAVVNFASVGEVMGYVQIPTLGVKLPIYEGTSEEVLNNGIGWVRGSSLPVGGESSHTVLSGHRGLPTSRLFTDIDRMVEGDEFFIVTAYDTLAYEVVSVRIVEPNDIDALAIREGSDQATLLTCHPYMINSHRLLVTGERIPYTGQLDELETSMGLLETLTPAQKDLSLAIAITIGIAVVMLLLFMLARAKRKRKLEQTELGEPCE